MTDIHIESNGFLRPLPWQPEGNYVIQMDLDTSTLIATNVFATVNGVVIPTTGGPFQYILSGNYFGLEVGTVGIGATLDHEFQGDLAQVLLTQMPMGESRAAADIGQYYGWEGEIYASDPLSVAEPAILGLLILGLAAVVVKHRRQHYD